MSRYSVAFMSHSSGNVWVKSYRNLVKAKRAAAGVFKKTKNDPLIIMKNSVRQAQPSTASYKRSKGWNYGKWTKSYSKVNSFQRIERKSKPKYQSNLTMSQEYSYLARKMRTQGLMGKEISRYNYLEKRLMR
jgi:hypothetical protein